MGKLNISTIIQIGPVTKRKARKKKPRNVMIP